MLDFNSHDVSAWMSGLLDEALEAADAKALPRAYLGASSLGEACARRLQFRYFATPRDPGQQTPGRTMRLGRFVGFPGNPDQCAAWSPATVAGAPVDTLATGSRSDGDFEAEV